MRRRRFATSLALAAALCGAAAPALAAQGGVRAPRARPDVTTVEGGLWELSDQAERHVKASAELNKDPALNAYVKGVLCKVAADHCGDLRIYVLDRPLLNASVAPNGYVEVNSGLLLRARTEDELAYVLGHEVSHFTHNHAMASLEAAKRAAGTAQILSLGIGLAAGVAGAGAGSASAANYISAAGSLAGSLVYLGAIASIMSFSREQELEADAAGYRAATKAGYAPNAGVAIWSDVIAETKASDFKKVRESEARASIFRTHPITSERIAALQTLGGDKPAADDAEAARRYRAVIRPHLAAWLRDDLRRRDFGETLHLIDRLAAGGEDLGVLEFFRGEAHRQRRGEGDAAKALVAYRAATALPDAPVAAWRELGDAAKKAGDKAAARDAFQAYLSRAPEAQDRWLVESSLKSLQET